jgi:hypothetical protein
VIINEKSPICIVGRTVPVIKAGDPIPEEVLRVDTLAAIPGPQSQFLRLVEVNTLTGGERQLVFSNLVETGRRVYTLTELNAIRPIGFLIPDRAWNRFTKFKEGGLYQAWPNGRLFRVRNRHLIDAYQGVRVYSEKDKDKLPALIPVFILRWEPQVAARTPTGVPQGDEE